MGINVGQIDIKLRADIAEVSKNIKKVQRDFKRSFKNIEKTGKTLTRAVTLPTAGLFTKVISDAAKFETALVGLGKTSNLSGDDLKRFGEEFRELSLRIPSSVESLLGFGQTAAQLGVTGKENILKFAETMARLESATDIAGEAGAASITRLLNVTGEGVGEIDKFANVLVGLGNASAATEAEILDVATKIAQAGAQFGLTSEDALALGAAMKSMGIEAELGGSSFLVPMQKIQMALAEGGEDAKAFAEITGNSVDQLAEKFANNGAGVFQEFIAGLSRMQDEGQNTITLLDDLGLGGRQLGRTIPTLAANYGQLSESFKLAASEAEKNNAATNESNAAFETFSSKLVILNNAFKALSGSIAETGLIDWAAAAVKSLSVLLVNLSKTNPELLKIATASAAIAAAAGPLTLVFGSSARGAISLFGVLKKLFLVMSAHPFVAVATALATLGIAIYANRDKIIELADTVKQKFDQIKDSVTSFASDAVDSIKKFSTEAIDAFKDFADSGVTIAADFVEGFVNGITNGIGTAVKTVTDLADKVSTGFKNFFKIGSPSKLMMEYGVDITEGLALGIEDGTSNAVRAAEQMAEEVVNSFDAMADRTRESLEEVSGELETSTGEFEIFGRSAGEILVDAADGSIDFKDTLINSFKEIIAKGIDLLLKKLLELESFDWGGIASAIGDLFSGDFDLGSIFGGTTSTGSSSDSGGGGNLGSIVTWGKKAYDAYKKVSEASKTAEAATKAYSAATEASGAATAAWGANAATAAEASELLSGGLAGTGGELGAIAVEAEAAGAATASSFGASVSAAGPYVAAFLAIKAAFDTTKNAQEDFRDKFTGVMADVRAGATPLHNLAGGFQVADEGTKKWVRGSLGGLQTLRNELNYSSDGWRAFLQTAADGSGILNVVDNVGQGINGLNDAIRKSGADISQVFDRTNGILNNFAEQTIQVSDKVEKSFDPVLDSIGKKYEDFGTRVVDVSDHVEGVVAKTAEDMTKSFGEFGERAGEDGAKIKESYIQSTALMTQSVVDMGQTSNTVAASIIKAFNTSGITIENASKAAAAVMSGEFETAANILRNESTSAAQTLRQQLEAAARAATGDMRSFGSATISELLSIISAANRASSAIRSIPSGSASIPDVSDAAGKSGGGFATASSIDTRPELSSIEKAVNAQTGAVVRSIAATNDRLNRLERAARYGT